MIGRTLAHYEITSQLGKGGMGEVYRARDTKLDRDVALKVLPQEMSADPERKARFEREARSLASLQHPNVASIYGFEEADGVRFLVMELVEGEDLARRLEVGSIHPDEAREIARQLAAGLEAAHDTGLVHRDLKPANVMVGPEGEVKILDFGLARAWFGEVGEDTDPSMSPTITAAMTQAGTILGTAAYMSPEQARGRKVDRRADIWAFGVILYEMLSGARLFEGDTVSDTLAAVLRAEPDWKALPAEEAPELCHLVHRCLHRDPRQRLRDIGEARLMLEPGGAALSQIGMAAADAPVGVPPQRRWLVPLLVGVIALGAGALLGLRVLAPEPEVPVVHAMIPPPPGKEFHLNGSAPAIAVPSPDGQMIVFGARGSGEDARLYLRRVDQGEATLLSGTETAAYPFWSPDSKYIGFFDRPGADGRLRKVSVNGGPPSTLCPANNGKGGTWNEDGTIVFAPSHDQPLYRVSSTGGDPQQLTEFSENIGSHRHPRFLPDGRRFLFIARPSDGSTDYRIMLGDLDGGEPHEIGRSAAQAGFSAGYVLAVREGVLGATRFDQKTGELTGDTLPLVEGVQELGSNSAFAPFSANAPGLLLYQAGNVVEARVLLAFSIADGSTRAVSENARYGTPAASPAGGLLAVPVVDNADAGADLFLVDTETGLRNRFTFEEGNETMPVFTPDGSAVAYAHQGADTNQIVLREIRGTAPPRVLAQWPQMIYPTGFSPDGRKLLFTRADPERDAEMMVLDLESGGEPESLASTPNLEATGRYSPDGRWIAYTGTGQSSYEVFVIPAAGGSRKWQVSPDGGVWPRWSRDGTRIYYPDFDGTVMAVEVDGTGDTFQVGAAQPIGTGPVPSPEGPPYAVSADGTLLYMTDQDPSVSSDISDVHLITDWTRALVR